MRRQSLLPLLALALFAGCGHSISSIAPTQARDLLTRDGTVLVLDVRTPEEYNGPTGHIAGAVLIPVQKLEERIQELAPYKDRTIVVYCRTGHRSLQASEILTGHGFHILNMEGGITRWIQEGLPTQAS